MYSARDLARALPAAWQESIKQGRKWAYRRFLNRVEFGHPWFYRAFDLPTVLTNWIGGVPPERVHLVTVPQRGADPGELFRRFCTAFGIDPAWAPLDSDRLNTSLGVAETQVIRQLNRRMDRATRREKEYDELIRELLAQDRLVHRDSAPVRLPPGRFAWANEQAESWIEWVKGSGIHVVGDLDDLRPVPLGEDEPYVNPDKVPARAVLGRRGRRAVRDDPRGGVPPGPAAYGRRPAPSVPRGAVIEASPEVGERRAWGWVAHLREGGTTPWQAWSELGRVPGPVPARRPAARAAPPPEPRRPPEPGPGRRRCSRRVRPGAAGRTWSWSAPAPSPSSARRRSTRPACPPASWCASPRACWPTSSSTPARSRPTRARRPSWWRRGYRLVGDPELADDLRGQLVARGRPPGGREPRILVLGTDLAAMTAHAWTHRAFTEGTGSWREWLRLLHERSELPQRADLVAVARTWERRVGKERVHVVLDPAAVPRLAGDRRRLTAPTYLPGEAGELARRVGSVLALLVLPEEGERLLSLRLRPRVRPHAHLVEAAAPLGVPAAAPRLARGRRGADAPRPAARWLRCARQPGRPRPALDPARGHRTVARRDARPRRPGAARRRRDGADDDQAGPPPRRHPQDRHVVPPGRAVPQQAGCWATTASCTPPTGSTPTSWPRST